jgi:hypothetical protein
VSLACRLSRAVCLSATGSRCNDDGRLRGQTRRASRDAQALRCSSDEVTPPFWSVRRRRSRVHGVRLLLT